MFTAITSLWVAWPFTAVTWRNLCNNYFRFSRENGIRSFKCFLVTIMTNRCLIFEIIRERSYSIELIIHISKLWGCILNILKNRSQCCSSHTSEISFLLKKVCDGRDFRNLFLNQLPTNVGINSLIKWWAVSFFTWISWLSSRNIIIIKRRLRRHGHGGWHGLRLPIRLFWGLEEWIERRHWVSRLHHVIFIVNEFHGDTWSIRLSIENGNSHDEECETKNLYNPFLVLLYRLSLTVVYVVFGLLNSIDLLLFDWLHNGLKSLDSL